MEDAKVLRRLNSRLNDARQLVDIHTVLTGDGRGRRYDVDALNRGAVILSIAAWESFVEDLAKQAAHFLTHRVRSEVHLPENVKSSFLAWVHSNADFRNPTPDARIAMWSLAGEGWRAKLREFIDHRVENLHNPGPKEVKKLFKAVLDIEDITESWGYHKYGPQIYRDKLDSTLLLRHRIAHGVIGEETVGKVRARDAIKLVANLAQRSASAVDRNFERFDLRRRRRRRR